MRFRIGGAARCPSLLSPPPRGARPTLSPRSSHEGRGPFVSAPRFWRAAIFRRSGRPGPPRPHPAPAVMPEASPQPRVRSRRVVRLNSAARSQIPAHGSLPRGATTQPRISDALRQASACQAQMKNRQTPILMRRWPPSARRRSGYGSAEPSFDIPRPHLPARVAKSDSPP